MTFTNTGRIIIKSYSASENLVVFNSELSMQQFVSFATTTKHNVIEPQGPEKMRKIFRSWCLDGVATINIVMQWQTTLWPENMVTLSRQYCRVPSSEKNLLPLRAGQYNMRQK